MAVDLFAGAGGFSLGFEQAGFDILASVEYDPIHCAVHAYNFPQTEVVCADVRHVTAVEMTSAIRRGWKKHGRSGKWDGELDAIVGGPPCQGFSVIGKRQFDDTRNQLIFSFAKLVGELRPRYFVMENVPGMSSLAASLEENAPKLMDVLIAEFAAHGYRMPVPETLNAAEFGIPQDRRRLILIGTREDCLAASHPARETVPRTRRPSDKVAKSSPLPASPPCPTVADAIGDIPNLDRFTALCFADEVELGARSLAKMHAAASSYARRLIGLDRDEDDYSYARVWDEASLTSSHRTIHTAAVAQRFAATAPGHAEPVSRLVRLHSEGVSSTLRAGTHYERGSFNAPRPIHPKYPRVISVREAARLHSFPDWFRLHWTKWHGFREVGNALPPRLGRAVGRELIRALKIKPQRPSLAVSLGYADLLTMANMQAAKHFEANIEQIPRHALRTRPSRVGNSQVESVTLVA